MLRAFRAEGRGEFQRALKLIDEAAEITPLKARFRVKRASILLRLERVEDAYRAFDALRQEFKDSAVPERQYLLHYCTAVLSMMQPGSGQWSYEAKQANAIKCPWYVKGLLPMVSADEIHDRLGSRS